MNTDQLWKAALGQLELKVSRGNFLTWFQATKISQKQGGTVVVETPNAFTYEWLSKKYQHSVLEVLRNLDQSVEEVHFTIKTHTTSPKGWRRQFRILARKRTKVSAETNTSL